METEPSTGESPLQDAGNAYQAEQSPSLSEAVLVTVASKSDLDTLELADEFGPLYDVIDPSALDSLFHSSGESGPSVGCVSFDYAGYRVTVDQTGRVELTNDE